MRQFTDILSISTRGRGLVEITRDVLNWLKPYRVQAGLLTLFCRHTSAGLLIQENAAPDVRADLETFFDRMAPEDANSISAHGRRRRRHACAHSHGADRGAACDPDSARAARFGDVAGDLLVRAQAFAASTRDRLASDWRMTGRSHKRATNPLLSGPNSTEITRNNGEEVSVDETSMTPGTPYFSGRLPRTVIKA